jgi:hypothetical protein
MDEFEYEGSHKDFQTDAIDFTEQFTKAYTQEMTTGKYKQIGKLIKYLKDVEKIDKNMGKMQGQAIEKILTSQIKKAKFAPEKAKPYKKQQRVVLTQTKDLLTEIADATGIENPNKLVSLVLQAVASGQDFTKATGDLKEAVDILSKIVPEITELLVFLTQVGNVQTAKGKARKNEPAKVIANSFGVFNEIIVGDVISSIISGTISQVPTMFTKLKKGKVTYRRVGREDVAGNITDTMIYMENAKGEVYDFGVDVKFHMSDTEKSKRKYERGGRESVDAAEVLELAPIKDVAAMIYLMTNSYFMGSDAEGDFYNKFLGGHDGEIFKLFNLILGLYGLLPPDAMFTGAATKPEAVEQLVLRDNRMFITINATMYPMTLFLKAVRKQVLGAGIGYMGKPIRGLRANFEKIMEE